uniref:Uncharacterized protein n=1 Tax=Rhizophora mucronata TaxID=61149 RepID=A0A2P2NX68_RHIMU
MSSSFKGLLKRKRKYMKVWKIIHNII